MALFSSEPQEVRLETLSAGVQRRDVLDVRLCLLWVDLGVSTGDVAAGSRRGSTAVDEASQHALVPAVDEVPVRRVGRPLLPGSHGKGEAGGRGNRIHDVEDDRGNPHRVARWAYVALRVCPQSREVSCFPRSS